MANHNYGEVIDKVNELIDHITAQDGEKCGVENNYIFKLDDFIIRQSDSTVEWAKEKSSLKEKLLERIGEDENLPEVGIMESLDTSVTRFRKEVNNLERNLFRKVIKEVMG